MELILNGVMIEYELENEKNMLDITKALVAHFLEEETKKHIASIVIDGKEILPTDEKALQSLLIEEVQRAEFEFLDITGVSLLSLQQMVNYFSCLKASIENNIWDPIILDVYESFQWMVQGVHQVNDIFSLHSPILKPLETRFSTRIGLLSELFAHMSEKDFPIEENKQKSVKVAINDAESILFAMFDAINPERDAKKDSVSLHNSFELVINKLEESAEQLPEVPILLQKGNDRDAMGMVQRMANAIDETLMVLMTFQEINREVFNEVKGPMGVEDFFSKLTGNLKELVHSMEVKDSLMIGDLIEYEFLPHIEDLISLLKKLKNVREKKVH